MNTYEGRINYERKPEHNEFLLFTGNAHVKANGALVMGRGAALQVRDYHTGAQFWFGERILDMDANLGSHYGLIINSHKRIGVFQVKVGYHDKAELELIDIAARTLNVVARVFPHMRFTCNYPGVGNGGLDAREVHPVLKQANLPHNVTFWR